MNDVRKVVLAYSGGLDTSVILRWLIETYRCEVIAFAADIGQKEELSGLREKAIKTGAAKIYIDDLQEELQAYRDKMTGLIRENDRLQDELELALKEQIVDTTEGLQEASRSQE